MSFSSWFTAARMKSLTALIPAVASALAIVIAAVKPTGAPVESSSKGYEILRQELLMQHQEIAQMNKSMIEMEAWLKVLREREIAKRANSKLSMTPLRSPASVPSSKTDFDGVLDVGEDLPPVPEISSVSPPAAPPPANSVFGNQK